jgi:hypothetical protein
MNKKSRFAFYIFSFLSTVLMAEIAYLNSQKSMAQSTKDKKVLFVSLTGLPDLAFSSQSSYIRHRSLSMTSGIYSLDGCLREYDTATYAIANSTIKSAN